MNKIVSLMILSIIISVNGCASRQIAQQPYFLDVQTSQSPHYHLTPKNLAQRRVYINIKPLSALTIYLEKNLRAKHYTVVKNPKNADYIVQGGILKNGIINEGPIRIANKTNNIIAYQMIAQFQITERLEIATKKSIISEPFNPFLVYGVFRREVVSNTNSSNYYNFRIISRAEKIDLDKKKANHVLEKAIANALGDVFSG